MGQFPSTYNLGKEGGGSNIDTLAHDEAAQFAPETDSQLSGQEASLSP
jgi:hypothetical protein